MGDRPVAGPDLVVDRVETPPIDGDDCVPAVDRRRRPMRGGLLRCWLAMLGPLVGDSDEERFVAKGSRLAVFVARDRSSPDTPPTGEDVSLWLRSPLLLSSLSAASEIRGGDVDPKFVFRGGELAVSRSLSPRPAYNRPTRASGEPAAATAFV